MGSHSSAQARKLRGCYANDFEKYRQLGELGRFARRDNVASRFGERLAHGLVESLDQSELSRQSAGVRPSVVPMRQV